MTTGRGQRLARGAVPFGLAPQPKGIGDGRWAWACPGTAPRRFGLAPQPKGIGDQGAVLVRVPPGEVRLD